MQEAVRSQFGRRSMVGFIVAFVAAGLLVQPFSAPPVARRRRRTRKRVRWRR